MLKILRHKNVSKVIFWALVILILPAFVLWGTGSIGRGSGPAYVGTIENRKVTFEDFSKSIVGVRAQIILNYFDNPKTLEALLKNRSFLGRLAWDRLILLAEVKKAKIAIPDSEVIAYITKTNPIFTRGGAFDEQLYEYILRNNLGLDPRTFEEIVRQNLAIQRMNDALTKDIAVTDAEVLENYKKENQSFKVAYLSFPAADYASKAIVTDDEVTAYYDAHKQEMVVPVKGADGTETMRAASIDDAKGDIRLFLAEKQGARLALERAQKEFGKIAELTASGSSLADAAAARELAAPAETDFFAKDDYLDGIGEAELLVQAVTPLEKGQLAGPVETRRGAIIVKLIDVKPYDEAQFAAEKEAFAKKTLGEKKTKSLEDWLRSLEGATSLNINLDEYQKYYR